MESPSWDSAHVEHLSQTSSTSKTRYKKKYWVKKARVTLRKLQVSLGEHRTHFCGEASARQGKSQGRCPVTQDIRLDVSYTF